MANQTTEQSPAASRQTVFGPHIIVRRHGRGCRRNQLGIKQSLPTVRFVSCYELTRGIQCRLLVRTDIARTLPHFAGRQSRGAPVGTIE